MHASVRASVCARACVCVCPWFYVIGLCVALNSVVEEKESCCFAHCIFAFMFYVLVRGGGGSWAKHLLFTPKTYHEYQTPQKIFVIFATLKISPFCTFNLKIDPKYIEMTPKTLVLLWSPVSV